MTDFIAIARQYEDDILSGAIPACMETRAAIERARHDHARSDEAWAYRFDDAAAIRACRFMGNLRHVKSAISTKAGEFVVLLPWQIWFVTELYGWVRKDTGNRRWKKAWVQVGKGNGKSTLAGCIAIYDAFIFGANGNDVLCAASQREQATIVLDSAREMLLRDRELCKKVGLIVQARKILQKSTQSEMRALPASKVSNPLLPSWMKFTQQEAENFMTRSRRLAERPLTVSC
jgi:phage terminase large subunit-like protein